MQDGELSDTSNLIRIVHKFRIESAYLTNVLVKMRNGEPTGESFASIRRQSDEISRAMVSHGVDVLPVIFYGRKLVDRSIQRVRARNVCAALAAVMR